MTDPQNPNDPASNIPPAPPAYGAAQPQYGSAPQPQYGAAPQYAAAPPPAYGAPANAPVPGRTMGIIAFVLSIVLSGLAIIPLILGIVALVQSRKAGRGNGWAIAAIIISAIAIVVGLIVLFALVIPSFSAASTCIANPDATVTVWGVQVPCSEVVTTTP